MHEITHSLIEYEKNKTKVYIKSHGREWRALFEYLLNKCGYWVEGKIKATGIIQIERIEEE